MATRKILYSPGHGAGWTTWADEDEYVPFMLTYQPFIDALEAGREIDDLLVEKFEKHFRTRFGEDAYVCTLDASDLQVLEVSQPFRINEYDGYESVEFLSIDNYIYPADLPQTR